MDEHGRATLGLRGGRAVRYLLTVECMCGNMLKATHDSWLEYDYTCSGCGKKFTEVDILKGEDRWVKRL